MRRQLGKQKSQHTLAMGHQSGWLELFCSYSPLRNGSRSSCLASHRIGSLLKDGGGLLGRHNYHMGKGCQGKFNSDQDSKLYADNEPLPDHRATHPRRSLLKSICGQNIEHQLTVIFALRLFLLRSFTEGFKLEAVSVSVATNEWLAQIEFAVTLRSVFPQAP